MKKQLFITSIAVVAAISGLALLGISNDVDAANNTTASTTQSAKGGFFGEGRERGGKGGHGKQDMMGYMKGGEFGLGGGQGFGGNEAVQAAIKANDYNAFVTAWNADDNKPSDATVPTQDQFTKMVTKYQKRVAIDAAIEDNDYSAFVEASKPTQEEFNDIVEKHKNHQAIQTALDNNDYNAFVTAWNVDDKKPANATVPTQDQFTKMVERHQNKTANQ